MMRTISFVLFCLLVLWCHGMTGCGSQPVSNATDPLAFVEKIEKGEAQLKRLSEQAFAPVAAKTPLVAGDIIRTDATGEVVIRFTTGAVARVLPQTEYQLKERKVATTGQAVVYTRLAHGVAAFYIPKDAEAAKKFEVETDRAVASIKGTIFKLADDGTATTLSVSEGSVMFTSKTTGKSAEVAELFRAIANSSGLSEPEKFNALMDPDLAGAEEMLKGTR